MNGSILIDFVFYTIIAFSGYFSTFNKTTSLMLVRDPIEGKGVDYAILIAMFAVITVVVESVPVNYIPFRGQVFYIFFKREDCSNKEYA